MARLSLIDASFVLFETHATPMHVGGLILVEPSTPDYADRLSAHLLNCTQVHAPFNRVIHFGPGLWPSWKRQSNMDLNQHLFRHHLEAPGSEAQLQSLLESIHSKQMNRQKPLWECHLIDGLANGMVAIYVKIHHAYADGMKLSGLMQQMLSTDPDANSSPAFWQIPKHRHTNPNPTLKLAYDFAHALYHQVQELPNLAKLTGKLFSRAFYPNISRLPIPFTAERTLFNQGPHNRRAISWGSLPLSSVRRISQFTGASINEVVLAVCDAALHQYLIEHQHPSDKPLVAIMPVNMKEEGDTRDNHFSPALIELGRRQNQPTERLKEIMISSRQIKHEAKSFSPTAFMNLSVVTNALMLLIGRLGLASRLPTISNLIISNVPGPKEQRYLFGAAIHSMTPFSLLLPGQSLNITLFSYHGQLHIGIAACQSAMADADKLIPYISKALTALELDLLNVTLELANRQKDQQPS